MHKPHRTMLEPERLLLAYTQGYFPMGHPEVDEIGWYSPDPRGIIDLDEFHITRSLMRRVRQKPFRMTFDGDFRATIRACADRERRGQEGTWITEEILRAYTRLYDLGFAHSVEAWTDDERLVGGLYGVTINGAFFGESMFSIPEADGADASKICLVHLVERLKCGGYELLDTQMKNPHLVQFGCQEISRAEYLVRLNHALASRQAHWTPPGATA